MTADALFYRARLLANKQGSGVGQALTPAVFVAFYNAAQLAWFREAVQTRTDSISRETLAPLLLTDVPLRFKSRDERSYQFELPPDHYQSLTSWVKARSGTIQRELTAPPRDAAWVQTNWSNPLQRPDFDWEETYTTLAGSTLRVFYRDFSVSSVYHSYYRLPRNLDLPGYIHLDGNASVQIDPELDDQIQLEIVSRIPPLLT